MSGNSEPKLAIDPALLEALDAFIAQRDEPPNPKMSREDAVNVILADWLVAQGFLPLPDEDEPVVTAFKAAKVP